MGRGQRLQAQRAAGQPDAGKVSYIPEVCYQRIERGKHILIRVAAPDARGSAVVASASTVRDSPSHRTSISYKSSSASWPLGSSTRLRPIRGSPSLITSAGETVKKPLKP